MAGLKIGVNVRFKNPGPWRQDWQAVYRENLEYAAAADRLGFDGVWVPEHHCTESGYNPTPFLTLGAIASVTKRCWIGTQPLLLPLYNPVHVAEQAAVLDVLSGGRLILGTAAGYRTGDFEAIGVDRRERGARTEEALSIILRAFRDPTPFDYSGRFHQVKGVQLHPAPVQAGGPEVQLAVRSIAAAKRAGRHGLSVNLISARLLAKEYGPVVLESAQEAGHDPAQVRASILQSAFLADTVEAGRAAVEPYMAWETEEHGAWQEESADADDVRMKEARAAKGSAAHFLHTADALLGAIGRDVAALAAAGLKPDWVNLNLQLPGMPLPQTLECLERVAAEVLPRAREISW